MLFSAEGKRQLTAQRLPDGMILLEMAPMDNQRRLSQEQLQHAQQIAARDSNATIVFIVCDRGDRYLSTGVFPA